MKRRNRGTKYTYNCLQRKAGRDCGIGYVLPQALFGHLDDQEASCSRWRFKPCLTLSISIRVKLRRKKMLQILQYIDSVRRTQTNPLPHIPRPKP